MFDNKDLTLVHDSILDKFYYISSPKKAKSTGKIDKNSQSKEFAIFRVVIVVHSLFTWSVNG